MDSDVYLETGGGEKSHVKKKILKRKKWIFIFKDKNMNQNQACFTQ